MNDNEIINGNDDDNSNDNSIMKLIIMINDN